MNLKRLYRITENKEMLKDFLVQKGLIPLTRVCQCGSLQILQKGGDKEKWV